MSDQLAATNNLSLELVVMIVAVSIVAGTVDVLRQPGWAWKRAKESKPAYFVLVLLVPLVGLGMYLQIARPKVKAIASAGRAASLPFESFGDDADPGPARETAVRWARSSPLPNGSAASVPPRRRPTGRSACRRGGGAATQGAGPGGSFFSTGGDGGTATAALTRTYRPRQRTSIPAPEQARDDSASTSTVPPGWKADPTGRTNSATGPGPSGPRTSPTTANSHGTP